MQTKNVGEGVAIDVDLGIDLGTSGVRCVAVRRDTLEVVSSKQASFDEISGGSTRGGVRRDTRTGRITAPASVWAKGLRAAVHAVARDLRSRQRPARSSDTSYRVCGAAVSAQQHSFVLVRGPPPSLTWSETGEVADWLDTLEDAPVWMDCTASEEAAELRGAFSHAHVDPAACTGSMVQARFTGPQLLRVLKDIGESAGTARGASRRASVVAALAERDVRVCLASSFAASLLAGRVAPLDYGDASGMNMLSLEEMRWSPAALAAVSGDCGDGAAAKLLGDRILGAPGDPRDAVGGAGIAPDVARALGFDRDGGVTDGDGASVVALGAPVLCGTGDNLSAAVGVPRGHLVVSLGTSTTMFAVVDAAAEDAARGRSTAAPASPARLCFADAVEPRARRVVLVCLSNGSGPRDVVCGTHFSGDWAAFDAACATRRAEGPGGSGFAVHLPHPEAALSGVTGVAGTGARGTVRCDRAGEAIAVCEAQALVLRHVAREAGLIGPGAPEVVQIALVGGGSASAAVAASIADVFNASVSVAQSDRAALGAAFRSHIAAAARNGGDAARAAALARIEDHWSSTLRPAAAPHPDAVARLAAIEPAFSAALRDLGSEDKTR